MRFINRIGTKKKKKKEGVKKYQPVGPMVATMKGSQL